jgi:drug/metabolite transporter (DMT)-like permease
LPPPSRFDAIFRNPTRLVMLQSAVRWRLLIGAFLAVALDTATQTLWKISATDLSDDVPLWDTLGTVIHDPLFQLVGVLMIVKLINWLKLLEVADLSYAKPITSLSYVTVAIASVVVLGEHMHWQQVLGIIIVVAGVWLVSKEPSKSIA